ncbi:Aldose 1-epimerase family protein [Azotobacter vinelandii CA]|uniref:Putative glucose-6-phosphate 1-epimerase n=2 Tax=Azotobacter vinelandii TaxID=354 RepID=C1DK58_AZOVD|nr:D-hexose-6-phosphate mutarotase [Azotobacter vinelandii]ACO80963.1 Aldose 1-epimerase family protein [Azotobacter vinelandii DJ]AGK14222.1 Aldose 1-epimerase family protein [Azotobacter vinelandii CA]AGK22259.1 Aldose 1-epimerase family protein [Azotobacter vinelandii CA6]WKN21753.1 D-hexose-6-phosphate mutarotase [Azotobacter vinelandii]SFW99280.1 glucose-6-phosphate 1-epimerase [Azotobacter vinelandii]
MNEPFTAPQVERIEMGELPCWRIKTAAAELLVAEQGAQVLSYQRHGEQPLIWLSEQAEFRRGLSVRGGVPVCWPWFGDLARNPAGVRAMREDHGPAPAHGEVRGRDWRLQDIAKENGAVTLTFDLPQSASGELPGWPHALDLTLAIRLDERLDLSLTTRNRSSYRVALSQALHTYLAVGDIREVGIEGLDGLRYIETLEDWDERHQRGILNFAGETDRIYLDTPPRLDLVDASWKRRICLEASGSHSAIVWNPWIDKAARLSQFADDAWQRMLCIETANVLDDAVELAPEQSATLALCLWSEPL